MAQSSRLQRTGGVAAGVLLALLLLLGWYWSREPAVFWVEWEQDNRPAVTGYATTNTLIRVAAPCWTSPAGT
jgi:preprotein translocase subunit SecG